MGKYLVTVEEICTQDFEIEAVDSESALAIAEEKYNSGELVLSPGEAQFKQIAILIPEREATEWIEF